MDRSDEGLVNEIESLAAEFKRINELAVRTYSDMVNDIINDRITDEASIEQVMDGLLDFGDNLECLELYRKLCRHVYYRYPQLVGEHVSMFRLLFEGSEEDEKETE